MRTRRTPAILVFALLLAGCTSGIDQTEHSDEPAPPTSIEGTPVPRVTISPGDIPPVLTEDQFVEAALEAWRGRVPTEDEVLAYGRDVCNQLEAGIPSDEVSVVPGDGKFATWDNERLVILAVHSLCPQSR